MFFKYFPSENFNLPIQFNNIFYKNAMPFNLFDKDFEEFKLKQPRLVRSMSYHI